MTLSLSLDEGERRALEEALDDEYKSHATYAQVIRDFGPIRPFINIVNAEARHVSALLAIFERYGLSAPATRWSEAVSPFFERPRRLYGKHSGGDRERCPA